MTDVATPPAPLARHPNPLGINPALLSSPSTTVPATAPAVPGATTTATSSAAPAPAPAAAATSPAPVASVPGASGAPKPTVQVSHPSSDLPTDLSDAAKKRIPAFVRKLRSMLDNDTVRHICWTPNGEAFRVFDSVTFSRDVLPNYFKHNNWQSFIRQLNIYGFVKLTDQSPPPPGTPPPAMTTNNTGSSTIDWCFKHPLFLRHAPAAMEEIKRRTPKTPKPTDSDAQVASAIQKSLNATSTPVSTGTNGVNALANPGAAGGVTSNGTHPTTVPTKPTSATPSSSITPATPSTLLAAVSNHSPSGSSPQNVDTVSLAHLASNVGSMNQFPSVGAHRQQGPSLITSHNVLLNPNLALKSTAGSESIDSPISATYAAEYWPSRSNSVDQGLKRWSSCSISSGSSSTIAVDGGDSEVDQLRSDLSFLQGQLGTLKRHMEEMGQVQARAMAHVMQVLSSTHSPLASVTELEDCVETWKSMSEQAASLFPSLPPLEMERETDEVRSMSPCSEPSTPDEWDAGVEPTMLLLNGASLLDSSMTVTDGYESLDDAATLEPDEMEEIRTKPTLEDHRPNKKRRRNK